MSENGFCKVARVNYVVRGLMAATTTSNVIHTKFLESLRTNRHFRISANTHRVFATSAELPQGPSCIYVGPLETANKETLEALYCQVTISKPLLN